jgi:NADH:ubiquinone oxidoreductase subunit 5 (subunit L)/multisubunit Na+/H+ antiporter MnhA subunit
MEEGDHMIGLIVVFLPLLFSLMILLSSWSDEAIVAKRITRATTISLVFTIVLVAGRVLNLLPEVVDAGPIIQIHSYFFDPVFLFEEKALIFLGLSAFLYWIIARFSRVYLHREEGFKRFFRVLFLSNFGLNLLVTAGNFEILFAGWEIVGLTSFLLISFYRDRATPIWNAFRIYCVYRICDIGILFGAYLENHVFGKDHNFLNFDPNIVIEMMQQYPNATVFLGLAILLSALGKSAQFPFSFWLPRALEGPTPSTAVFYGALSIHAGLFLMLRTQPLWMPIFSVRVVVFVFGFISLVVGTLSGRAQANIKGQIGYACVAQVGIMFMEVSLGWNTFVLIHMTSHAILRAYQFLTSPSVVTHFIKHPVKESGSAFFGFPNFPWIRRLSIGEFFIEEFWENTLGKILRLIGRSWLLLLVLACVLLGFAQWISPHDYLFKIMVLSLVFSLRAFGSKISSHSMSYTIASIIVTILAGSVYFHSWTVLAVCALGIVPGVILWLRGGNTWKFLGWLCLAGFPISPFFIGEDLLIHNMSEEGLIPLLLFFIVFILNGIVMARTFVQETWLKTARPFD